MKFTAVGDMIQRRLPREYEGFRSVPIHKKRCTLFNLETTLNRELLCFPVQRSSWLRTDLKY